MIVRDRPRLLELMFAVRGSMITVVAPPIAFLIAVASVMVALHQNFGPFPEVDGFGLAIFGIALSLFLGFRNNAAYDRWWEARRLWGGLLADLRNLAREVRVFVGDDELRLALLRLALAFMHQHRAQLRGITDDPEVAKWGAELVAGPAGPYGPLDQMAQRVAEAHRGGLIDGFGARALTERMASMGLQQAGNERISNTPLPYAYTLAIYRTTYIYCLLLPSAAAGTCRAGRMDGPCVCGDRCLHVPRPGRGERGVEPAIRDDSERVGARCYVPRGGNKPRSAPRHRSAPAAKVSRLRPDLSRPLPTPSQTLL
jgi:putative membrane protein